MRLSSLFYWNQVLIRPVFCFIGFAKPLLLNSGIRLLILMRRLILQNFYTINFIDLHNIDVANE